MERTVAGKEDRKLEEYYKDFMQQILHGDSATFREEIFLEYTAEMIRETEGFDECQPAHFRDQNRGLRIDGHGGEPVGLSDTDRVLFLFTVDWDPTADQLQTLTQGDLNKIVKRGTKFIEQAMDPGWRDSVDHDHQWFETVELIMEHWKDLDKIRLLVVSNRKLSDRIHEVDFGEVQGKTVEISVWDIRRFHRMEVEGRGKEPVVVDLENDYGGGLPVIPADLGEGSLESFLFVMPAEKLAKIYDRWGTRLLEQNVRVFLQGRGKINRGMRLTMEKCPERFFSFNNGITVTAGRVGIDGTGANRTITAIDDLQIVNGGQTTASIHAALNNSKVNLANVFVQVKLSVMGEELDRDKKSELVSMISQYSNMQNKVNNADFFANHPYHVRIEGFSRDIWTPQAAGAVMGTKWFYERARGQYADERGRRSQAERKKFDSVNPKRQKFTKTDLAKYLMLFGLPDDPRPDIVSKGAEKCFLEFGKRLEPLWEKSEHTFNERHFQNLIARAIVFKSCDDLIRKADWYGGYKANIVAYTIAKLNHEIGLLKKHVNLDQIWTEQELPQGLIWALEEIARQFGDPADGFLATTADQRGMTNRSEWAKREDCWKLWRDSELEAGTLSAALRSELLSETEEKKARKDSRSEQKLGSEVQDLTKIVRAGPQFWTKVQEFGNHENLFKTPTEKSLIQGAISGRIPSERQVKAIMKIYKRFNDEGMSEDINDHIDDIGKDLA